MAKGKQASGLVRIKAKDEASATINKFQKNASRGFKRAAKHSRGLSGEVKGMNAKFTKFASVAKGAIAALAVGKLAQISMEFAKLGAEVSATSDAFNGLAAASGQAGDELLGGLKEGSLGAISNFEGMRQANKGLLLGLPLTEARMKELGQVSVALGQAMGRTADEGLSDMITGFGRGSAAILDNLGIMIDADGVYEIWADTLGKSADELTDLEKKHAVFQTGLAAALIKVDEMGGVQANTNTQIQAFSASLQDAKTDSAEAATKTLLYQDAISGLNHAMGMFREGGVIEKYINHIDVVYRDIKKLFEDPPNDMAHVVHTAMEEWVQKNKEEAGKALDDTPFVVGFEVELKASGPSGKGVGDKIKDDSFAEYLAASFQKMSEIAPEHLSSLDSVWEGQERVANQTVEWVTTTEEALRNLQIAYAVTHRNIEEFYWALGEMQEISKEQSRAQSEAWTAKLETATGTAHSWANVVKKATGEESKAAKTIAKIQGGIEAAWAIAALARYDFWAAAQHAMASVMFFQEAGGGGSSASAGGGGGGGGAFRPNYDPFGSPDMQSPFAGPNTPIIINNNFNPYEWSTYVSENATKTIVEDINGGGQVLSAVGNNLRYS